MIKNNNKSELSKERLKMFDPIVTTNISGDC